MVKATTRIAAIAMVVLGMGLSGCGGVPATPEQKRLAERQLLMPYLQNTEVACAELEVDITPNFHLHVSQPGVVPGLHRFDKEDKPALVEKTWRNLTGTRAGWFTVTISAPPDPTDVSGKATPRTTYTVTNQFTLRTHERAIMTLSARAMGPIVVVREAGGKPRDAREFAIANGVVSK
tara:strand:+ start:1047 stop:1580 length:534 start_codon:yes stop_codon:yes gene_type:complete